MVGKNHIVFGLGCYGLTVLQMNIDPIEAMWYLPLVVLGSLAPDLDNSNSKLKSNTFVKILTLPLTVFGHRTWSHSLLMLGIVLSPIYFVDSAYWGAILAFGVGYASHLLGDFLTPKGIPLFYPISTTFRFIFTFHTGSYVEYLVALIPLYLTLVVYFG